MTEGKRCENTKKSYGFMVECLKTYEKISSDTLERYYYLLDEIIREISDPTDEVYTVALSALWQTLGYYFYTHQNEIHEELEEFCKKRIRECIKCYFENEFNLEILSLEELMEDDSFGIIG